MREFFPKPRPFRAGGRKGVKDLLDLYNYATKAHLTYIV